MGLKQWTNAVIGVIDKKLERFDPKWQAANGKGGLRSRYEDKTGIARHREWRGVKDTFVDYTAWLNNLLAMGKMVASAPVPILKGFWEYRWMGSYLGTFAFIDRLFEGYREDELKIAHMNMHCIVSSLTKKIALVLAIIGGLNWGSVGIFQFDLVAWICGGQTGIISRIVYILVGLSAIWCITLLFRDTSDTVTDGTVADS